MKTEPKVFRVGDLVQAEISFISIGGKRGKCTIKAILRTLALINDGFAKVCITF